MAAFIRIGDCVKIPDGRVARVRERLTGKYKVRVRRKTGKTHQFLTFPVNQLKLVDCPKGWMSREGYNRYLKITLTKMGGTVSCEKAVQKNKRNCSMLKDRQIFQCLWVFYPPPVFPFLHHWPG